MSADDHRLILDCLKGNTNAFGVLVRRYQDRLYNTVYRLMNHAEDAQDVVQEVLLYRIAVNTAISYKRKKRVALSIDAVRNGDQGFEPLDPSVQSQPAHAMEQAEQERRVRLALNRMSPEHRAVLVMKDMEGQKYEAMAEVLKVPIGTIRSRLHRARLELRECLEREE